MYVITIRTYTMARNEPHPTAECANRGQRIAPGASPLHPLLRPNRCWGAAALALEARPLQRGLQAMKTPLFIADAAAEAATAAATELDARRELARQFRIEALLRQGPGGIVYLARDPLGRPVAVKVLPQKALGDAGEGRFRRAAESAAALDHPHIIPLYRFGATPGFFWYSTKHVEGGTLEDTLRTGGPLGLTACLRILEQIASALDYAHRRGVVHGGLTPASVMIDSNDWALVGDFAVAGLAPVPWASEPPAGQEPTPGGDRYALAALAYECLSGGSPTRGRMPLNLTELRPEIPAHASEALRRALSPRPTDGFPSVLDFVAALGNPSATLRAPWLGPTPRRGPGAPVVIIDPDERRGGWGRRVALLLGGMGALAAGVAWLNMAAAPAASPGRLSFARPAAPAPSASPATADEPRTDLPRADPADPPSASLPSESSPPTPAPPPPPAAGQPAQREPAATTSPDRRPALLSINAIPWGGVYIDGDFVGNTPQVDVEIGPGMHELRVEREGFQAYERIVEVAPGEKLRITDIVLRTLIP